MLFPSYVSRAIAFLVIDSPDRRLLHPNGLRADFFAEVYVSLPVARPSDAGALSVTNSVVTPLESLHGVAIDTGVALHQSTFS